jgi:hypothetical protein
MCEFGIEPPAALILDQRVPNRGLRAVLDGKREDRITFPCYWGARRDFSGFERKGEALDAESVGALEECVKAGRAPDAQRFRASLQRQRSEQS